jgi:hypothetical protein
VTGIILFAFFNHAQASSFIENGQQRCKIQHFWKKTWVLPWTVDIPAKQIKRHSGLPITVRQILSADKLIEDVFGA